MKQLVRLYDRMIEGLAGLAGLTIAGMCLMIVYDVIARNLGLQPPASTVAFTEYALLYLTMAGSPWLVRTRGHIVVEVLHARMGKAIQRNADRLILLICVMVSSSIAVIAALLAIEAAQRGEIEIRSLDMPRSLLFGPIALGFALMSTEFLRLGWRGESIAGQTRENSVV